MDLRYTTLAIEESYDLGNILHFSLERRSINENTRKTG